MRSTRIKILVLSHISELMGGAERSMLDVLDNLTKKHNLTPEFILREPIKSLAGELQKRGWKYHTLRFTFWSDGNPPRKTEDIFRNSVQNSIAIKQIEDIIQSTKPDIVATNSIISPWAAMAAHYQKIPHVWFIREYGDLDHGRIFEIGRQQTFEDVGHLSNLVVANSKTLAQHIEQYVGKTKVTTLYNPFNLEKIARLAADKVAYPYKYSDSLKLIMTSRVAPTKGQLEAVIATGLLNKEGLNVELCVVGEKDNLRYNNDIKKVINKYDLDQKVHLIGFQNNALAYVALADVGIIASRKEAFGRTTFEFLAIGKPVVGANSGATPEMVENNINGFLFEPQNVESLAKALKNYANDRGLIAKHSIASKEKAIAMMKGKYNAEVLYRKIMEIVENRGQLKAEPIHLTHRWLDYQQIADRFIKESGETSLRRLVRLRLRQQAKRIYYKARGVKARITGNNG